jgi:hypothetical protein
MVGIAQSFHGDDMFPSHCQVSLGYHLWNRYYAYPRLMDTSMHLQLNVEFAVDFECRVFAGQLYRRRIHLRRIPVSCLSSHAGIE